MAEARYNNDGERLCDQLQCDGIAVFSYVWTGQQVVCAYHAPIVLNTARAMGFPTPESTMKLLSLDEIVKPENK